AIRAGVVISASTIASTRSGRYSRAFASGSRGMIWRSSSSVRISGPCLLTAHVLLEGILLVPVTAQRPDEAADQVNRHVERAQDSRLPLVTRLVIEKRRTGPASADRDGSDCDGLESRPDHPLRPKGGVLRGEPKKVVAFPNALASRRQSQHVTDQRPRERPCFAKGPDHTLSNDRPSRSSIDTTPVTDCRRTASARV